MKIYSLFGTTSLVHDEHGEFEPDEDGGFELPHEFGVELHKVHLNGQKAWETDAERSLRIAAEEDAHRKDPATLLAAVESLVAAQTAAAEAAAEANKAPEKPSRARKGAEAPVK
jgi:hypothetical protein